MNKFINLFKGGDDFRPQILTSKVNPRAERFKVSTNLVYKQSPHWTI